MSTYNRNRPWHDRRPKVEQDPVEVQAMNEIRDWTRVNRWWIERFLGQERFNAHYMDITGSAPSFTRALVELRLYEQEVEEAIELAAPYVEVN